MSALQILLGFYLGTLLVNIVVAAIQFASDRAPVQRTLLFYWLGILASVIANSLVKEPGFPVVLVAAGGTFVSNLFLASLTPSTPSSRLKNAR